MRRQAKSYILTTNGFPKKLSTDAGGGGGGAAIIFVSPACVRMGACA